MPAAMAGLHARGWVLLERTLNWKRRG